MLSSLLGPGPEKSVAPVCKANGGIKERKEHRDQTLMEEKVQVRSPQKGFHVGRAVNFRYPMLTPSLAPTPVRIGTTMIC